MPWTKIFIEKEVPDFDEHAGQDLRKLTVPEAVREALDLALSTDKRVFVMGQGVDDPSGMFGMTVDLHKKYGYERAFDTPLSENALTGIAVGSAIAGMRPVYFHNRPDFLLLAMDQIVNHASKYSYMFGGALKVPMVIVAVIGRGWGSGAQHSQSLHGLFTHIPGIRVVMPSTAYDSKGLLLSSIIDDNPIIFIEHRWSFKHKSHVPQDPYLIPFGKGLIRRKGKDVTIVGISYMAIEALMAADELEKGGCDAEVIDPRTLRPLDENIILESVKKTGRVVIADTDWRTCGAASQIASVVASKASNCLKAPVRIVAWPDLPVPSSFILEEAFYPSKNDIIKAVKEIVKR